MRWRKSWAYENIYNEKGNPSSKRSLPLDVRAVWDDFLDLAALNKIPGQIGITANRGYSKTDLGDILSVSRQIIYKSVKILAQKGMVKVDKNGILFITNWKHYQSDYERQKPYRQAKRLLPKVTTGGSQKGYSVEVEEEKDKYKDIYILFNHWIKKPNLIKHHKLTPDMIKAVKPTFQNYPVNDLKSCIDSYDTVVGSDDYWYSYAGLSFETFFRKGVQKESPFKRFLPEAKPLENLLRDGKKSANKTFPEKKSGLMTDAEYLKTLDIGEFEKKK